MAILITLPRSIEVVWSNQDANKDPQKSRLEVRRHHDGAPVDQWEAIEVVDQSFNTADDHLDAAVAPNGRVYLATKNQVDTPGKPRLVLRLREPSGIWTSLPYSDRSDEAMPTRPIALLGGESLSLFLVHNVFPQMPKANDYVVYRQVDECLCDVTSPDLPLIPQRSLGHIRDPSSTREVLPEGAD